MELTEEQHRRFQDLCATSVIPDEVIRKLQSSLDKLRSGADVAHNIREIHKQINIISAVDKDRVRKARELDEEVTAKRVKSEPSPSPSQIVVTVVVEQREHEHEHEHEQSEKEDCLICKEAMETGIQTLTCPTCKLKYHATCLSEWFQIRAQCPHCSARVETINCHVSDFLLLLRHN